MSSMQTTVIVCDRCHDVARPLPTVQRSQEAREAAAEQGFFAFRSKSGRMEDYCDSCRDTPALLAAGYVEVAP